MVERGIYIEASNSRWRASPRCRASLLGLLRTYWCPQTLRFKCVKNCGIAASGGEGGIRTLARFYPANPLAGGPLWPLGYLSVYIKL